MLEKIDQFPSRAWVIWIIINIVVAGLFMNVPPYLSFTDGYNETNVIVQDIQLEVFALTAPVLNVIAWYKLKRGKWLFLPSAVLDYMSFVIAGKFSFIFVIPSVRSLSNVYLDVLLVKLDLIM